MASPNFQSILSQSPTEVIRPKPLPKGTYLCTVGQWEGIESSKKKTPGVRFTLKPLAPMEDVDTDDLQAAGGLEGKTIRHELYVKTDDGTFGMLDDFHVHCGIDLLDGQSRADRCDAIQNEQVLVVIKHDIDNDDPSRIFSRVQRTAKAE